MIRVGFVLGQFAQGWMGGVNYFRNLIHAIGSVPDRTIEPVLIVPPSTPRTLIAAFPAVEVLRTRMIDRPGGLARRAISRVLNQDLLMERLLKAHAVDVLSHSPDLGHRSSFATAGWIGDFQHRRMPEFFSHAELAARDSAFRETAKNSSVLLVSSVDAQRDLEQFAPTAMSKSRVLHFTSGYGEASDPPTLPEIRHKYGIDSHYFHLPNQFWAHKNHRVVIAALAVLKSRGAPPPLIICTGSTSDYRNPDYFEQLMRHVESSKAGESFKVLGMVSYEDLCALMRHSVAVINPSRFEGWSTTVEEAKSFGKKIILSDLPVHREQAPERGVFFSVDDADALAAAMERAMADHSLRDEQRFQSEATERLPERFVAFGRKYQEIIMSIPG